MTYGKSKKITFLQQCAENYLLNKFDLFEEIHVGFGVEENMRGESIFLETDYGSYNVFAYKNGSKICNVVWGEVSEGKASLLPVLSTLFESVLVLSLRYF